MARIGRPSMRELAARLGVDRATVSRALSDDKSHLVAPATRERIRRAALDAGYRLDLMAAALRRGKSHTVGVLVPDLGNEMIVAVVREIIARLDEAGGSQRTTPLIAETLDKPESTRRMIHTFLSRRVDAIITLASTEVDRDVLLEAAREVPVVLAVRRIESVEFPSSLCDDELGGALVARHFAERGHRVVCQVEGPPVAATFLRRARGFSEVCRQAGLTEMPARIAARHATSEAGRELLGRIFEASPRPTAVFAHNDALAVGIIEAMRHEHLRYPDDLAIVGFNDTQISRVLALPLTTVRYPVDAISAYAATLVRSLVDSPDQPLPSRIFAPSLVVRQSS